MGRCLDPIKEIERRRKIGLSSKGNQYALGYKPTDEQTKKKSESLIKAHKKKKWGFQKGHIPWHKDKKVQLNTGRTWFKKGHHFGNRFKKGDTPANYIDGMSKTVEYKRQAAKKRRAKKKQAEGSHTFKEWKELKERFNYTCLMCGLREPFINQLYQFLTEDHVIPLIKGGTDYINNIQPLCLDCNSKKRTRIIFLRPERLLTFKY